LQEKVRALTVEKYAVLMMEEWQRERGVVGGGETARDKERVSEEGSMGANVRHS